MRTSHYTTEWRVESTNKYRPAPIALFVAAALVFLTESFAGEALRSALGIPLAKAIGLDPASVFAKGWLWQLLTHPFYHSADFDGVIGLVFLGLSLWYAGSRICDEIGNFRFVMLLILTGLATGTAASFYLNGPPEAGSLACAFAIAGAYGTIFAERSIFGNFRVKHLIAVIAAAALLSSLGSRASWLSTVFGLSGLFCGIMMVMLYRLADAVSARASAERSVRASADDADLEQETDAILDKINRSGMQSLSRAEKKTLKKASEIYKKKTGKF